MESDCPDCFGIDAKCGKLDRCQSCEFQEKTFLSFNVVLSVLTNGSQTNNFNQSVKEIENGRIVANSD